jgi:asparagine synthase (glutamine-hydrolysing)
MLSFYKGIKKLPNASYMIVREGKIVETGAYAHLGKTEITPHSSELSFLDTLVDEMRPSDVGFASFLSGGIDSSYICSALKKYETAPTDAYTLKIPGNDEDYERAKYVAQKLNLTHHVIELRDQDLLRSIDETVKNMWEPYFHITSVYADLILWEAKKQHRVFFTWAWGDECYYGYDNLLFLIMECYFRIEKYTPKFLKKILNTLTNKKIETLIFSSRNTFKKNYYTSNYQKISHLFKNPSIPHSALETIQTTMTEFVDMYSYIDMSYMYGLFVENLHSLTLQWDAIGMKNSLEIRSLFLERRVIERAYSIPLWKKISLTRLREGKEILRKGLTQVFSKEFVFSKKIGFWVHFNFRKYFLDRYFKKIQTTLQKLEKRDIFVTWFSDIVLADFEKNYLLIMKLYALEKCLEFTHYPNETTH